VPNVVWLASLRGGTQLAPNKEGEHVAAGAGGSHQVEGDPVVEVQEATDPLTPDEVREAQESEAGQP
jgi:hypothetical protein